MFGKFVVGTYLQDCCIDRRFMGEHMTVFKMKKREARKLVKRRMNFRSLRQKAGEKKNELPILAGFSEKIHV